MEQNIEQLKKLKSYQDKMNQQALQEIYEELPESFIQFTNTETINYCLHQVKTDAKRKQTARVLNNWINNEIILINDEDKGKIRRFDRLESIWLSIVVEARKFGIPLESLKQTRKELTLSPVENFSLLKFSVLDSIMRKPKVLMLLEDGNTNIVSLEAYSNKVSKGRYPTHILFKFLDFISLEYPNNAFSVDFNIPNPYENMDKMTILYFLKTGDFKSINLHINKADVRLIENSNSLTKNKELMKFISSWNFIKAEIIVDDDVKISITL